MKYCYRHKLPVGSSNAELSRQNAIHVAGHAAAICLYNKQNKLPPIFFRISQYAEAYNNHGIYTAQIEDGCLIPTPPSTWEQATDGFSPDQKRDYERAFKADIINLLAGPLAEAKHVALRNGEKISPRAVILNALHYYGGCSDLNLAYDYLACFMGHHQSQHKTKQLFFSAFEFINAYPKWQAINALADYMLTAPKAYIDCEEAFTVLNTSTGLKPLLSFSKQSRTNSNQSRTLGYSRFQIPCHAK
ncbi:MAG: hypothetical protein WC782_15550 [Methylococcaceae bacterium]|jgi:hypothetical protein